MRKNILVAFIMAMSLCITACGASENVSTSATEAVDATEKTTETVTVETEPEKETHEAETEPTEPSETESTDASEYREAYQKAMLSFMQTRVTPTGKELEDDIDEHSGMAVNRFAICDIDNDGVEELLIEFTNASMAGMHFEVCQYDADTGDFILELDGFPAVRFFDNGLLAEDASHNQGPSKIWPYSLYSYDASSDSYVEMYYVDSWDKELVATDYNGNAFPEEVDTSKTGCVYYIKEYGNTDTEETPLDESVYNAFVEEKFGSAKEIEIDYLSITEENIAAITN